MIEFLFFFCMPTTLGYDCNYSAYMADLDTINEMWWEKGNKGYVAGFYDGFRSIYIPRWDMYQHEWRHTWCENHYNRYFENHTYCLDPHFKIQR